MGPRIGTMGEISPCSPTLGALMRFSQTAFSFALDKRTENILNPEEVISGQPRLHSHTEQRAPSGLEVLRTLISAERSSQRR